MEELWKDIPGFAGRYQVSNLGKIKSLNYNRSGRPGIIKLCRSKKGYLRTTLWFGKNRKTMTVHRVVSLVFIDNPKDLKEVNHIDGDKENNAVQNLEWCTRGGNIKHAYKQGLRSAQGGNNANAKLKESDVLKIRGVFAKEKTPTFKSIAQEYKVSPSTIKKVVTRQSWPQI